MADPETMKKAALYVALLSALVGVVIHVALTPDHLEEEFVIGVLFGVHATALAIAMLLLYSRRSRIYGFLFGSLVSGAQVAAFVLSRTTGLPGLERESWWGGLEAYLGLAAISMSIIFIAASAVALRPVVARSGRHRSAPLDAAVTADAATNAQLIRAMSQRPVISQQRGASDRGGDRTRTR